MCEKMLVFETVKEQIDRKQMPMKKKMQTKPEIEGVVAPEIVAYAERHSTRPSALRRTIRKLAKRQLGEDAEMQLGFTGGSFLAFLVQISGAKHVLELGTLNGATTLAIAEKLPSDGRIATIERDEEMLAIARKFWSHTEHVGKIIAICGDAKEMLRQLVGIKFDIVFVDANKESYPTYWELALPLVNQGGLIVVDDVLCDGEIVHPRTVKVRRMAKFNEMVARDKRVEVVLLPMLDGITLARKK